jgi:hypothetical protein
VPAPYPGVSGPTPSARSGTKDGRTWRFGTDADVAWIQAEISLGLTITSAIPPVFEAYATLVVPDKDQGRAEDFRLILQLLNEQSPNQPWWLGYLETGGDELVFPDARRTTLYSQWPYVLVEAGSEQAARWRQDDLSSWRAPGPDLIFPADHSWLVSWLWDDDWRCIGGSAALIARVLAEPRLQAQQVHLGEDATPPGHLAR